MPIENYKCLHKEPNQGAPLIFTFHGTGGDEFQFYDLAQQLVAGAGVVSPRGDVSERGAMRFFHRSAEGVYDMKDLAARTDKMIEFISAYKERYPDNPAYGFGYSNGANILASVVMKSPELFERSGLLHPLITWKPHTEVSFSGRHVLVTAGKHDPICPWPMSEKLIRWFQEKGAKTSTEIHEGGHELWQSELNALSSLLNAET